MGFILYPAYNNIYEGPAPSLNEVLKGIPSGIIVSFACHINAQKHLDNRSAENDFSIFRLMIERLPSANVEMLTKKMVSFAKSVFNSEQELSIFPLPQMLQLIEWALANYLHGSQKPNPQEEEGILKAVLILNERAQVKHLPPDRGPSANDPFLKAISMLWPMILPNNEHIYRKDFIIPLYQSTLLLDFLGSHKTFGPFLELYLKKNGVNTPAEYLKHLVSFYLLSFNKEKGSFFTFYNEEGFKQNPVLLQFVREINKVACDLFNKGEKNLKLLREKPILKTSDNRYFITNWNFIIDKIYEGLKYDFFENSGVLTILGGNDNKEKWNSFTGIINQQFSEKIVFLDVVKRILDNNIVTCIPENVKRKWNQDLYLRQDNHISFIEFKGAVLPISDDYKAIKNDIEERMSFNQKDNSKKAVFQLVDQITDFHSNIDKFEPLTPNGHSRERLFIHPIIVYTDYNWGMPGINEYLNRIFLDEINKKGLSFFKIRELTMIHLSFFNTYEKIFLNEKKGIHQVIHGVQQYKAIYRDILKKTRNTNFVLDAMADFEFYASKAFKSGFSHQHEMSLFKETMKKLGVPEG